jgi:CRP-like cAMP-binding protein
MAFLRSHPHAFPDVTDMLARELAIQQLRLERQSSESIVSNLALLMLMLSARFGSSQQPDAIPKPLTARRWLAAFLGVSPESLQRALRTLCAEGLVSTADDELRILDRRLLQERANVDDSTLALFAPRQSARGLAATSGANPGARRHMA